VAVAITHPGGLGGVGAVVGFSVVLGETADVLLVPSVVSVVVEIEVSISVAVDDD
jgi:hypothetical protein